jgi:peptidoglycan/LPS O-acetylase OafA/YrhL
MNGSRKHIELLDYVRAIAIISVLLFHSLGSTFAFEDLPWHGWVRGFSVPTSFLYFLPFSFGQVGVAIFFVVSGFCIHLSFQQQGKEWRGFWIRRFWRIYPAYIAATAVAVLFLTTDSRTDFDRWPIWEQLAAHLFLIQNVSQTTFMGLNGSFWSLAIEAQLYLLYPLLLVIVGRLGWRQTLVLLGCCEFLIRSADGVVQTTGAANTVFGHMSWLLSASPLGYWFSWTVGARLADSFLKNEPLPFARIPLVPMLFLTFLSYFIRPLFPFLFVLAAMVTAIAVSRRLGPNRAGVAGAELPIGPDRSLTRLRSEATVGWQVAAPLTVFRTIGLWSYSIYLLHQPLMNAISLFISSLVPGPYRPAPATFLYFIASWLIVIPISGLWYHVFELPGIGLGKWIIQKRKTEISSEKELLRAPAPPFFRLKGSFYGLATALVIVIAGSIFATTKMDQWDAKNELQLAEILNAEHKYRAALWYYRFTLEHDGRSVAALNNAAWLLATAPDPRLRDGNRAMDLARRACELTGYKQPFFIGTLAAACAEAGRFNDAITNAQRARAVASSLGQFQIAARDEQLLELYRAGKPFHEAADAR